jgi:hemoglobin-like flavoprotein
MGGEQSLLHGHHHRDDDQNIAMCVQLVLPLYFTTDPITPTDLGAARASWNLILNDGAPGYIRMKADPNFTEISCLTYFYSTFYGRLFDIHPACRCLFRNSIQVQGKALAKIISFLLKDHNDPVLLNQVLLDLAERHVHTYHVKAHEYSILGEVLLHALAKCIGGERFDEATTQAWVRIYSMVIAIVIPFHVKHELHEAHGHGRQLDPISVASSISVSTASGSGSVLSSKP